MDELTTFCHAFPSWVGSDGLPLSWRHFRYGMAHLARDEARRTLQAATSARISQADRQDFSQWRSDMMGRI